MKIVDVTKGDTPCGLCGALIPEDTLVILSRRLSYHFACWKPYFREPLSEDMFQFQNSHARTKRPDLKAWIYTWNQQFLTHEQDIPAVYFTTAVPSLSTPLRRLLLTVYQYLTVKEVETRAALCCKAWYHMSRDGELWRSRYIAIFRPTETDPEGDYRKKYILNIHNTCWACGCLPSISHISTKCPFFQRPLCIDCAILRPYSPITLKRYARECCLTMTLLADFRVPTFSHAYGQANYFIVFAAKIVPYMEKIKGKLIDTIKHREGLEQVQKFDVVRYYIGFSQKTWREEKVIAKFLGRKRKESSWKASVCTLLSHL